MVENNVTNYEGSDYLKKMKFTILFSILVIKPAHNVHNNQILAGRKVALIAKNCD